MNLIIDVGNSFVKLAVFKSSKLLHKEVVEHHLILNQFNLLIKKYNLINKGIISSVGKLKKTQIKSIGKHLDLLVLDSNTKLPFKNLYKTPKTLGVDRIALVCASVEQFPDKNVLIIDAGTCITYDFVNVKNEYLGGAISPGLNMRYKSLNNLTANLPLLSSKKPKDIIGNSTKDSIHSGVVNGIVNEIDGVIVNYKLKYPDLTVILTGGDANFLSKQLKSSIFALPNFLIEGLNYILQFNTNE
ncbi:type III pantothenate kinase [Sabulilitoribacter multivorans]|uniref:Type III pantothenate kinase n=1 Tax=Flaviramulus multivorans TaxID=1304750 RepID=A0ABS9ILV9_9FLAO|nr:type III pantothenate kinase [Flaviramulus multivorans]MCF7561589.1 type III pantothenate kinase [Flaviramulus multivorans]